MGRIYGLFSTYLARIYIFFSPSSLHTLPKFTPIHKGGLLHRLLPGSDPVELQKDMKTYILHIFRQKSNADIGCADFIFKIGEWILLTLNRLSNNYGLSWMRGICFTLIFGYSFLRMGRSRFG